MDSVENLECDYLVIGAGPRCMAFTDILLTTGMKRGTALPRIVIVDDKDQPGGHWNTAPRFFRLQEDSHRYGVNSRRLERTDILGVNGETQLPQHASVTEVLGYYTKVMEDFLDSGMVQYFPKSYVAGTVVRSVVNPDNAFTVSVKEKIVHSTPIRSSMTPASRPFKVRGGALVVSPSGLSSHSWPTPRFVVIGSGKVGINIVLWLLSVGVDPSKVHWVMPRQALLMKSEPMEGPSAASTSWESAMNTRNAATVRDALELGLESGHLSHIHEDVLPECYHLASITQEELQQLRRIKQIVRLGHVVSVHPDRMHLERGKYSTGKGTLHIDCTSSWLRDQPDPEDIFQSGRIVLQPVVEMAMGPGVLSTCLSAALIGVIECLGMGDDDGNALITGTRLPDTWEDWSHMTRVADGNPYVWDVPQARHFLSTTRLSSYCGKDTSPLIWFSASNRLGLAQKAELLLAQHFQERAEKGLNSGLARWCFPAAEPT